MDFILVQVQIGQVLTDVKKTIFFCSILYEELWGKRKIRIAEVNSIQLA